MRGLVVLAAVMGCYAPSPPTGAPCTPGPLACPTGQACEMVAGGAFECVAPGTGVDRDAADPVPVDVNPNADDDGDTVKNADDNCPLLANPNQANEDGDRFGDVCDPCPPIADSFPVVDPDGDNVSGNCDPEPDTPGDRIVAFEGFTTPALPAGWSMLGNWSFDGEHAVIVSDSGDLNLLSTPVPAASTRLTVVTEFLVDDIVGNGTREIGPVQMLQSQPGRSIHCQLRRAGAGPQIAIIDTAGPTVDIGDSSFEAGQVTTMTNRRSGSTYRCDDKLVTVAGSSTFTTPAPAAGMRTHSVSAHVEWILIVGSP
jgi:hypothetical protein